MFGGVVEGGDRFGASVSIIDATGDGNGDLVAGAPYEECGAGSPTDSGAIGVRQSFVEPASRSGVAAEFGCRFWGPLAAGAGLGSSLAAGR